MGKGKHNKSGGKGMVTAKTYALFHGSPNAGIEEFDIEKAGMNTSSGEKFLFFTDSKEMADDFSYERLETSSAYLNKRGAKGRVYEVDVTMEKPLDFTNLSDSDVKNLVKMSNGELTADMAKRFSKGNNQLLKAYIDINEITKYGYDGFIAKMDNSGALEYAVADSKKVKIKK